MKKEVKTTIFDKIWLWLNLPDIPTEKKYTRPFKILKSGEYNLMRNTLDTIPSYITQIKQQNNELEEKDLEIETLEKQIKELQEEIKLNKLTIKGLKISNTIKEKKLNAKKKCKG